jgi:hypothetical protein
MATFSKFNVFTVDLTAGKHDFSSATYKVMLTNTAPVATNAVKADITEITAANGYSAGGPTTTVTRSNASGVETILCSDVVVTATGAVGPFRYAVLYNDTQTTPAKPLVGWADYGSAVTMANADTFTVDFDGTNGVLQVG